MVRLITLTLLMPGIPALTAGCGSAGVPLQKAGLIEFGHDFQDGVLHLEVVEPTTTFRQRESFAWVAYLKHSVQWPANLHDQLSLVMRNGFEDSIVDEPMDLERPSGLGLIREVGTRDRYYTANLSPGHYRIRVLDNTEPLAQGDFTVVP